MGSKKVVHAIILWSCLMLLYFLCGLLQLSGRKIPFVVIVNVVFTALCFFIVKQEQESREILGFNRDKLRISCLIGLLCSVLIVMINGVIPGMLRSGELASLQSIFLYLLYFMFFIAFPEEVIFRGFLLSRLEEKLKNRYTAILLSGLLFMLLHIPYQAAMSGGMLSLLSKGYGVTLIMTFVWHIIFCILLKSTGAIYGVILFHGFMDWSNILYYS